MVMQRTQILSSVGLREAVPSDGVFPPGGGAFPRLRKRELVGQSRVQLRKRLPEYCYDFGQQADIHNSHPVGAFREAKHPSFNPVESREIIRLSCFVCSDGLHVLTEEGPRGIMETPSPFKLVRDFCRRRSRSDNVQVGDGGAEPIQFCIGHNHWDKCQHWRAVWIAEIISIHEVSEHVVQAPRDIAVHDLLDGGVRRIVLFCAVFGHHEGICRRWG